jgi:hypothetical protein
MSLYCGNNRKYKKLVNGQVRLGTVYECFKNGIGVGLNLPYDENYDGDYEPIDRVRIYCGTKKTLPEDKDRFGTRTECHRNGVGLGKSIKAKNRRKRSNRSRRSRVKRKVGRSKKISSRKRKSRK